MEDEDKICRRWMEVDMCDGCNCGTAIATPEEQTADIAAEVVNFCEQYAIDPKTIIESVKTIAIERLQKRIIAHEMVISDARAAIQRLDYEIAELNRK